MVDAIVPSNRNSGIPCPELYHPSVDHFVDINDMPFDTPLGPDRFGDLHRLVAELTTDEGLGSIQLLSHAVALGDRLITIAVQCDDYLALHGNPNMLDSFAIPKVVQPLTLIE